MKLIKMKQYKFLILSNQPFDFELKTNKWHVANILARKGHQVVFVDPPLRFKALKNFLKNPSLNLGQLFFGTERKNENLIVYRPANIFNFHPFSLINTSMHAQNINKLLNSFVGVSESKTILWIYHFDFPDLENFMDKIDYDLDLYDCVDEYTAFPEYSERKKVTPSAISWIQWIDDELKIRLNQKGLTGVDWVLRQEKWLADATDLMFVSAPGLVLKFKNWREDVHYLPNGAAVEKFLSKDQLKEPDDLKNISHPRIGFTGAIDAYKNNINLIEESAKKYPQYHFVMIGPEKVSDPDLDLSFLKSLSNVHFLGMRKWELIPSYFAYFDAFFIPYNLNDYTVKGCFPVKYFEALAAGLPTVVTNMPAYEGFDVDGYVSVTDEDFIKNLKKAVEENSLEKIEARKKLASHNSWDGKVDKQLKLIADFLK